MFRKCISRIATFSVVVLLWSRANADPLTFTEALEFLRTACASGTSVSFSTDASGAVTMKKFTPKGEIAASIGRTEKNGSANPDNTLNKNENEDIRRCMSQYVPRLMNVYFPEKQGYDWRKDAERFTEIYTGFPGRGAGGQVIPVGDYQEKLLPELSYTNVIGINATMVSRHVMTYRKGVLEADLVDTATLSELNELARWATGTYNALRLNCAAGECVRTTGWHTVSPARGIIKREDVKDEKSSFIEIPTVNNFSNDLRIECQKIFARLISANHSDEVVCREKQCRD